MKVKQFAGGVDAAGKSVKGASDGMAASFGSLEGMIKKAAAALALWKTADFVKDSTMAAARFETLGVVLERLSKNTAYTTAELKQYEQGLRDTGIAGIEARVVMAQMIQSNLDLSKSTELARVAQDAAVIANLNSSETLERMMHAIQANSVEIVRTIGLQVSFEDATKRMAASLGKTTEQLTEQEKMQARLNAVIQAGALISGAYESAMNTAGKQINSFRRYVQDFEIAFGKAFNPALTQIVFGASEAIKELTKTVEESAFQSSLEAAGKAIGEGIVTGMQYLIANKEAIKATFAAMADGISLAARIAVGLNKEIDELRDKAFGIDRRSYADKLRSDIASKEKMLAYYEKTNMPGRNQNIETLTREIQLLKDKIVIYEDTIAVRRKLKAIDSEGGWAYQASGRGGNQDPGDLSRLHPDSTLSKEAQAALKKFWIDYDQAMGDAFGAEKRKLDEQLKEYSKHVHDKAALDRWYSAELQKALIKAYGEGGIEAEDAARGSFRSIGELMQDTVKIGDEMVKVWDSNYHAETRFLQGFQAMGDSVLKTVVRLKDAADPESAEYIVETVGKYVADMGKIVSEAEKIYGKFNAIPKNPPPPKAPEPNYDERNPADEDWAGRHRADSGINVYRPDAVKEQQQRFKDQEKETSDWMIELNKYTLETIQDQFAGFFDDLQDGEFKSFGDYVLGFFKSLGKSVNRIVAQWFTESLFGKADGSGGGMAGELWGWAKTGISSLLGSFGGGPSTPSGWANPYQHHTGGIVGLEGARTRLVPAWAFAGAPRLHGGLAPDEFQAILKKDEGVFTPAQMRALGSRSSSMSISVPISITAGDGEASGRLQSRLRSEIEGLTRRILHEELR
jgi:hypothetical protein